MLADGDAHTDIDVDKGVTMGCQLNKGIGDIYYVLRDAVSATKVKVRTTIWAAASTIIDINEIIRVFPPSLPEARTDFFIYIFF